MIRKQQSIVHCDALHVSQSKARACCILNYKVNALMGHCSLVGAIPHRLRLHQHYMRLLLNRRQFIPLVC